MHTILLIRVISRRRSLIVVFAVLLGINGTLTCHFITFEIFVIGGDLVNQRSVRKDFHNTVCRCLYKLVIVAGEECNTGELDQSVVQGSDGLHIQVVGGFIENQTVCTADHHLGKQTAYLFSTG